MFVYFDAMLPGNATTRELGLAGARYECQRPNSPTPTSHLYDEQPPTLPGLMYAQLTLQLTIAIHVTRPTRI